MQLKILTLSLLAAVQLVAVLDASAQAPTGNISGRVFSSDGQPLPGVTVSVTSPNLQGTRSTVSSERGDYLISLLPPGTYSVAFESQSNFRDEITYSVLRSDAGCPLP